MVKFGIYRYNAYKQSRHLPADYENGIEQVKEQAAGAAIVDKIEDPR